MQSEDIISTPAQNFTVVGKIILVAISICCSIASVGVLYGGYTTRLSRVEEDQKATQQNIENDRQNLQKQLEQIRGNMVDKEDFREVQRDIKQILRQQKK